MNETYLLWFIAALLFPLTLIFLEIGRRFGRRRLTEDPEGARAGASAVEGAVFALFGLLIAFTFTGAASRFEARRDLIVTHTNAIGTAWLRLDLLPAEVQPALRQELRLYVDAIIKMHEQAQDTQFVFKKLAELGKLQDKIWNLAETAASRDGRPQVATLVLPALNEMFDLTSSRYAAARFHVSMVVIWFLVLLSMLASLLVGYAMASAKRRNWLHIILFALLISLTLYVIFDFEYPRYGVIRLDQADTIYLELRQSMQ
jgi:ABC-type glycerol-3-phosphate transport system permease component